MTGFEPIKTFKVKPGMLGFSYAENGVEPSFVGYDHPAVFILRKGPDFRANWSQWRQRLASNGQCADDALHAVAAAIESTPKAARPLLAELRRKYPTLGLTDLLEAHLDEILGAPGLRRDAMARYSVAYGDPSLAGHLVPAAAARALHGLGLEVMAMTVLRDGAGRVGAIRQEYRTPMAASYVEAATEMAAAGASSSARETCAMGLTIAPSVEALNGVGMVLYQLGDTETSSAAYTKALGQAPHNITAQVNLAWNHYVLGDLQQAISANRQILADGPNSSAAYNLALAHLASGETSEAEALYERAVREFGANEGEQLGAVDDLRALLERGINVQATRRIIARYWH